MDPVSKAGGGTGLVAQEANVNNDVQQDNPCVENNTFTTCNDEENSACEKRKDETVLFFADMRPKKVKIECTKKLDGPNYCWCTKCDDRRGSIRIQFGREVEKKTDQYVSRLIREGRLLDIYEESTILTIPPLPPPDLPSAENENEGLQT